MHRPEQDTIDPKLIALAAKIDEAKARADQLSDMVEGAEDQKAASRLADAAFAKYLRAEHRLSKAVAANLAGLALKARYVEMFFVDEPMTVSIIRDLLALSCKPKAAAPKEARQTA